MSSGTYQSCGSIKVDRCMLTLRRQCTRLYERSYQSNHPMSAHRTIPLVVHEQHTQISFGRHRASQHTSIHISMSAWLQHQRLTNMIVMLLHIATTLKDRVAL